MRHMTATLATAMKSRSASVERVVPEPQPPRGGKWERGRKHDKQRALASRMDGVVHLVPLYAVMVARKEARKVCSGDEEVHEPEQQEQRRDGAQRDAQRIDPTSEQHRRGSLRQQARRRHGEAVPGSRPRPRCRSVLVSRGVGLRWG